MAERSTVTPPAIGGAFAVKVSKNSRSFPKPPSSVSLPRPPKIPSSPSVPAMVSSPSPPRALSNPVAESVPTTEPPTAAWYFVTLPVLRSATTRVGMLKISVSVPASPLIVLLPPLVL